MLWGKIKSDYSEKSCGGEQHAEDTTGGAAGGVRGQRGGNYEGHSRVAAIAVLTTEEAVVALGKDI